MLVHHRPADGALVLLWPSLRAVEPDQSQQAGNRWPTNPVSLSRRRRSYIALSVSLLRIFLPNPTTIAFPFSASPSPRSSSRSPVFPPHAFDAPTCCSLALLRSPSFTFLGRFNVNSVHAYILLHVAYFAMALFFFIGMLIFTDSPVGSRHDTWTIAWFLERRSEGSRILKWLWSVLNRDLF